MFQQQWCKKVHDMNNTEQYFQNSSLSELEFYSVLLQESLKFLVLLFLRQMKTEESVCCWASTFQHIIQNYPSHTHMKYNSFTQLKHFNEHYLKTQWKVKCCHMVLRGVGMTCFCRQTRKLASL